MRVQDSNLNSVSIGTTRTDTVQSGRAGSSGVRGSYGQDQISLSDLGSLVRSVSGETTDRTQMIDSLAAAYKSGSYQANALGAAQGIIDDAIRAN